MSLCRSHAANDQRLLEAEPDYHANFHDELDWLNGDGIDIEESDADEDDA